VNSSFNAIANVCETHYFGFCLKTILFEDTSGSGAGIVFTLNDSRSQRLADISVFA
jgi:hypothetical protein